MSEKNYRTFQRVGNVFGLAVVTIALLSVVLKF